MSALQPVPSNSIAPLHVAVDEEEDTGFVGVQIGESPIRHLTALELIVLCYCRENTRQHSAK